MTLGKSANYSKHQFHSCTGLHEIINFLSYNKYPIWENKCQVETISQRGQWQPTPVLLAWKIPWTEEPGGLQSMGSHRVRHDWGNLAAAAAETILYWKNGNDNFLWSKSHKVLTYYAYDHLLSKWKFVLIYVVLTMSAILNMAWPSLLRIFESIVSIWNFLLCS